MGRVCEVNSKCTVALYLSPVGYTQTRVARVFAQWLI